MMLSTGGDEMERRWVKAWPPWVPKVVEPEKPTSETIRDWASLRPDRVALSFYGRDITYQELDEAIDGLAAGLIHLGVQRGDRVALYLENCPQFVISYFAIHRAGGVVVPLNPMFKHLELEYEIRDAQAEIVIGLDTLYPELEKIRDRLPLKHILVTSLLDYVPESPIFPLPLEAREQRRSFSRTIEFSRLLEEFRGTRPASLIKDMKSELALLQYTGGTTGLPKGAMITHYTLSLATLGAAIWYHHREEDVHLGVTPFFHIMGQQQLMCAPLVSGGQVVILARFHPGVVAKAIHHYRCTFWVAATTMVIALLDFPDIKGCDFSSFRCLWSGGTPISVELQKRLKELAPKAAIGEGYGLSECISQGGAITPLYRYKPGYVGTPHLNDIKIMDLETGAKELPADQEGEIVIGGPAMMQGYWNKPEETKEVLKEGWLHTGDIGLMDEEGYLKILGRRKELIKCSGYSVFPAEVENLLYRHPAVAEAAVIGVPDYYRGESPKAFIVLKPEYRGKVKEEEMIEWSKENMAAYKRPRIIEFREELPKSGAGKILKRILAEEEKSAAAGLEQKP
jgi:acyl-CoA synthetase (AMP-forming)/AMP-acid ligase II